jgi:hypothetical protein
MEPKHHDTLKNSGSLSAYSSPSVPHVSELKGNGWISSDNRLISSTSSAPYLSIAIHAASEYVCVYPHSVWNML